MDHTKLFKADLGSPRQELSTHRNIWCEVALTTWWQIYFSCASTAFHGPLLAVFMVTLHICTVLNTNNV